MITQFEKYNDIILDAFQSYYKSTDLVAKKHNVITQALQHYELIPKNILFLGFSPAIFKFTNINICVAEISDSAVNYLRSQSIKFDVVDLNNLEPKQFDLVVAVDEYFTFAESDQQQKILVQNIARVTRGIVLTSLKDYKNQDYRDKDFSQPISIRNTNLKKIFFEGYDYDPTDKNSFNATNYIIDEEGIMTAGPFARRNMYFKQLAKFSLDSGAKSFLVHNNLMYKNIIKKNYEHLITIEF